MPENIKKFENKTIGRMLEGYDAFWLSRFVGKLGSNLLYVVSDGLAVRQTASLLAFFAPKAEILTFPAWDTVPYDRVSPNAEVVANRIRTLDALLNRQNNTPKIVIASIGAVLQKLPPKKIFLNTGKTLQVGQKIGLTEFLHYAALNGYSRVEQVMENGEYAVRGDIIDIFPMGSNMPIRIDFFDDEIEKMRFFDAYTQRSAQEINSYNFQVAGEVTLNEQTIKTFRGKYRELFGAAGIKDEIYLSISEGQKYPGMENWLPLFYDENLPSLFDYMPDAQVIFGKNISAAAEAKVLNIIEHFQARNEALIIKDKNDGAVLFIG